MASVLSSAEKANPVTTMANRLPGFMPRGGGPIGQSGYALTSRPAKVNGIGCF